MADISEADPRTVAARLVLHYAIQPLASTSAALASPAPDGSHLGLEWDGSRRRIQTVPIPAERPVRITLDPPDLRCSLIDGDDNVMASVDLACLRVGDVFDWLRTELNRIGLKGETVVPLLFPTDDFPFHTLALGDRFPSDGQRERDVLASLYHTSAHLLTERLPPAHRSAPLRLWPHHLDLARLLSFPDGKSVGVGFSPGDQAYGEPYWYVSPWPYPTDLPGLRLGHWHTAGWTGAVLRLSEAEEGADAAGPFLQEAFAAACRSLEVPPD
jgi:hypothetical protein